MRLPWVSFCSDAESLADEGAFLSYHPHPRAYGSFARVIGKYVRDEELMSCKMRSAASPVSPPIISSSKHAAISSRATSPISPSLTRRVCKITPCRAIPINTAKAWCTYSSTGRRSCAMASTREICPGASCAVPAGSAADATESPLLRIDKGSVSLSPNPHILGGQAGGQAMI